MRVLITLIGRKEAYVERTFPVSDLVKIRWEGDFISLYLFQFIYKVKFLIRNIFFSSLKYKLEITIRIFVRTLNGWFLFYKSYFRI